jgi:hypothetical protein
VAKLDLPAHKREVVRLPIDARRILAAVSQLLPATSQKQKGAEALRVLGAIRLAVGLGKADALWRIKDKLEGHQTVMWCWHKEVIEAVKAYLASIEMPHDVLDGATSGKRRAKILEEWHLHTNWDRVLVASIAAACSGVSFPACDQAIFIELDWSPVTVMQAEKRHHRFGNLHELVRTLYLEFVSPAGVPAATDAAMLKALERKIEESTEAVGLDSQTEQIRAMLTASSDEPKDNASVLRDLAMRWVLESE